MARSFHLQVDKGVAAAYQTWAGMVVLRGLSLVVCWSSAQLWTHLEWYLPIGAAGEIAADAAVLFVQSLCVTRCVVSRVCPWSCSHPSCLRLTRGRVPSSAARPACCCQHARCSTSSRMDSTVQRCGEGGLESACSGSAVSGYNEDEEPMGGRAVVHLQGNATV